MAVRPVRVYPDPCLKKPAPEVRDIDKQVRQVCRDLVDTMKASPRCVGLAAPQIGSDVRAIVVDVGAHPRGSEANHGLLVLINPQILETAGSEVGREGCLSLPDITASIRRAKRLVFEAMLPEGGRIQSWTAGFEARALQHEIDHVDGILILDRVASPQEIFSRSKPESESERN